jgi:hypothetical protein
MDVEQSKRVKAMDTKARALTRRRNGEYTRFFCGDESTKVSNKCFEMKRRERKIQHTVEELLSAM